MTMTPGEEFRVLQLEEQVLGLRKTLARYRVNGADEFLQGGGLRFGQYFDIGRESLQLRASDDVSAVLGTTRAIIYFVDDFAPNPPPAPPYAFIGAASSATTSIIELGALNEDSSMYSQLVLDSTGSPWWRAINVGGDQIEIRLVRSGSYVPYLYLNGTDASFGDGVNLYFQARTSDGNVVNDGVIWFRGDTQKMRLRSSSANDNFAMESWVTSAVATGDESYAHALMVMGG